MVVIDTSVAYKWFSTEEEHVSQALKLLNAHLQKKEILVSPNIIIYELANAWATKTKLPIEKIKIFLKDFEQIKIKIEPMTFEMIEKAAKFSKDHHVSVYDASYAVLAEKKKCNFITADSKFVKQINLPFVKLLAQYPLAFKEGLTKNKNFYKRVGKDLDN